MLKEEDSQVVKSRRLRSPRTSLQEVKGLKPDESYMHLEADGLPLPEKYLEGWGCTC